jgi:hypothetical protein
VKTTEIRFDIIGVDSLYRGPRDDLAQPTDVRIRVAGRTETMAEAIRIGNEVETLFTNGPAGGGGASKVARQVVAVVSILMPRELVRPRISYQVA